MSLSIDIQFKTATVPPPPVSKVTGWRCKWTAEGGNDNPLGMPAVTPSQFNGQKVAPAIPFTQGMQQLALDVMMSKNYVLNRTKASVIYDRNVAFCNTQGWGFTKDRSEYIHRRNYFLGEDLSDEYSKIEDGIICSGGLYNLQDRADGHLWAVPGVSGIDVNQPLPTVSQVFANGWYFYATSNTAKPSHFPQGWNGLPDDDPNVYYGPVILPYFLSVEIPYTKAYFKWWEGTERPDPLRYY